MFEMLFTCLAYHHVIKVIKLEDKVDRQTTFQTYVTCLQRVRKLFEECILLLQKKEATPVKKRGGSVKL
jgi:hypothetical protein